MNSRFAQFFGYIRHRPIVTACIVLTVLLVGVNHYLWKQRAAYSVRHGEARRNGEFMLQALGSRGRIDTDLAALREAMAQIEGNLLDEHSMEVNLGYFYRYEKMARVRLMRLNQLAAPLPPTGARFKSVPFSMQVAGTYTNAMNFLRNLESGPRILRVRNCTFERTGENSGDLTMELTLEVLAKI